MLSKVDVHEAGSVKSYSADVTNVEEMKICLDGIKKDFGSIDFVFTCAGLSRQAVLEELGDSKMKERMFFRHLLKLVIC